MLEIHYANDPSRMDGRIRDPATHRGSDRIGSDGISYYPGPGPTPSTLCDAVGNHMRCSLFAPLAFCSSYLEMGQSLATRAPIRLSAVFLVHEMDPSTSRRLTSHLGGRRLILVMISDGNIIRGPSTLFSLLIKSLLEFLN